MVRNSLSEQGIVPGLCGGEGLCNQERRPGRGREGGHREMVCRQIGDGNTNREGREEGSDPHFPSVVISSLPLMHFVCTLRVLQSCAHHWSLLAPWHRLNIYS